MNIKDKIKEALSFQDLTEEEKQQRGILGRLYGPCASICIPTRNGRLYQESLWDYQFDNNDILKELIENGGVPMELDHPTDRDETCSDRIAAMMPELPKKDKDGHLICYVDIIDTPMGKIAYQLAKYGFKLGISSRGNGDIITDENGNEAVDPETYDLQTFDLVLVPAVKDARLTMTESLQKDKNYNALKVALTESLNQANKEDRALMEQALNDLGITLNEGLNTQKSEDIKQANDKDIVANNDGTNEIIKSLTEALKDKTNLENQVKELQEALAVRDSKVNELSNKLDTYKDTTIRLTNIASKGKDLSKENSQLKESLEQANKQIEQLNSKNSELIEQKRQNISSKKSLNESILKEQLEKKKLNEQLTKVQNELNTQKQMYQDKLNKLQESFKNDTKKLNDEINQKSKLVEQYKKIANNTVNKYIDSKAIMLGVSSNEIKNRLPQSYTLNDIDMICENLQSYSVNINKLPFDLRTSKVQVQSPKENIIAKTSNTFDADDISGLGEMLQK